MTAGTGPGQHNMDNFDHHEGRRRWLSSTACSLKEACQEAGFDEGGRRCRDCPVRDLCEDESRWLVKRVHCGSGCLPR